MTVFEKEGRLMTRKQRKMLWRIIIAAALTAAAWLLPVEGIWKALAFVVPYLIAGWDVLLSAVRNILHGQVFDEIRSSLYLTIFFRKAVEVAVGHFLQFVPGYVAFTE